MNQILIIILFLINVVKNEEYFVRVSVIPEYEQNLVTVLMSFDRVKNGNVNGFSFTLPNNIDSVYIINRGLQNELGFNSVNYYEKDGFKWLDIPNKEKENVLDVLVFTINLNTTEECIADLLFICLLQRPYGRFRRPG